MTPPHSRGMLGASPLTRHSQTDEERGMRRRYRTWIYRVGSRGTMLWRLGKKRSSLRVADV